MYTNYIKIFVEKSLIINKQKFHNIYVYIVQE